MHRTITASALFVMLALGAFVTPATASAQSPPEEVVGCYDGTCTLSVSGPVDIPLDGRAGITSLSVTRVGPYAVTFAVRRGLGRLGIAMTGTGGTLRFGQATGTPVRVRSMEAGTAVLDLRTTTRPST